MNSKFNYDTCFTPFHSKFTKVTITPENDIKIATAIKKLMTQQEVRLRRKLTESEQLDFKKTFMKLAGEVVLEQYIDLKFVKFDQVGSRTKPFLNEMFKSNIDIVVFSYGKFPLVFRNTYRKTIFICMLNKKEFLICGMATPLIVNGFSKGDLVESDSLRSRGTHAGFFGFYNLAPLPRNAYSFKTLLNN